MSSSAVDLVAGHEPVLVRSRLSALVRAAGGRRPAPAARCHAGRRARAAPVTSATSPVKSKRGRSFILFLSSSS